MRCSHLTTARRPPRRRFGKYAGHPQVACVFLPSCCVDPLYGNRRYDPVYDAAQECGLPVVLHAVTAINPVFPFNLQGFETAFMAHAASHTLASIVNAMSMLETGVPVRFPDLRIAFTEGGVGWVPWLGMKLDKEYGERRREVPLLTERPSHYLQRMFFATQPIEEPEHLEDMATLLGLFDGENNVVFASDWPHHDFDHPDKVLQIPRFRRDQAQDHGRERRAPPRSRCSGAMKTEHTLGPAVDIPPGGHDVYTVAGRQIGVFNVGGELLRARELVLSPERAALSRLCRRDPRRGRRQRLAARVAAGRRGGRLSVAFVGVRHQDRCVPRLPESPASRRTQSAWTTACWWCTL